MDYLKKEQILKMENYQLVNAFERTVVDMTKCENFRKTGVSIKLRKQYEWIREELSSRMY